MHYREFVSFIQEIKMFANCLFKIKIWWNKFEAFQCISTVQQFDQSVSGKDTCKGLFKNFFDMIYKHHVHETKLIFSGFTK